jgi:hypothetical protein
MTLEQFLGNRYRLIARLPSLGATHQRYAVQANNGTPDYLALSYCDYTKPVSMDALVKQRRAAEVMMRPPMGLLCRVTDFQLKADYQWTVSEYPGDYSLRELLQQRQSLSMEEVEAFLRLITEACEAATSLGWPPWWSRCRGTRTSMSCRWPRSPVTCSASRSTCAEGMHATSRCRSLPPSRMCSCAARLPVRAVPALVRPRRSWMSSLACR